MKGYVALTTVLIIIPLLLITGVTSLYDNITVLSVSRYNYDSQVLRVNSQTCIEESIYKIKRSISFTGVLNISKENWSCVINISDKQGYTGIKILDISVEDINNTKLSLKKELDTNTNPFTLKNIE